MAGIPGAENPTARRMASVLWRYVVASAVAFVCEGLLVLLYLVLLYNVIAEHLPLAKLEAWCHVPFTNRGATELAADYMFPMVVVLLASRLLAGPVVSGSYAVWAGIGYRAAHWMWEGFQEPGYYLDATARMATDPLEPTMFLPTWWLPIIAFSMVLGWFVRYARRRNSAGPAVDSPLTP